MADDMISVLAEQADKIAELEAALAAAGQLDRMRVIGFNKV